MSKQGNRDREGNLGQSGSRSTNPTGTSGRQGGNSDSDLNRPKRNDDEESGIGNRNTNR